MNVVMNFHVPQKCGEFLTSQGTISFLRRALPHRKGGRGQVVVPFNGDKSQTFMKISKVIQKLKQRTQRQQDVLISLLVFLYRKESVLKTE